MSVLLPEIIACAIRENDIEVLLALDNHDAIDMPNVEGDIPLVQCIKHDRRQIFELLLDYGADPPPPTGPKRLLVESWPRGQRGRRSWSGLRSRPRGHGGHEDLRRGRLVSERAMRADGVEVPPPAFYDDLRLGEGVEDLAVEEFVAHPGIERLDEAVLPRAAGCDVGGLGANRADPFLHSLRDELRPII